MTDIEEQTPAEDAANTDNGDQEVAEVVVEESADDTVAAAAPRGPVVIDKPIQTVGRRKEAVVRVRLVPGTGKFHLDGRSLEEYFPNKVHQQLIKAPLVSVNRVDSVDIYAHLTRSSHPIGHRTQRRCRTLLRRPGQPRRSRRRPCHGSGGPAPHVAGRVLPSAS